MEINNKLSSKVHEVVNNYMKVVDFAINHPIFKEYLEALQNPEKYEDKEEIIDLIEQRFINEIINEEFSGEEQKELTKLSLKELRDVWYRHEPQ